MVIISGRLRGDRKMVSSEPSFNPLRRRAALASRAERVGAARGALVALAAFEAEITFLLAGRQEQIRARTERALLHLQRILAVDLDVSAKWKEAFNTREDACERLGPVHFLSHGIYAFKVDAVGAITDLVYPEPPPDALLAQAVEGMVLTEWKVAKHAKSAITAVRVARKQADSIAKVRWPASN